MEKNFDILIDSYIDSKIGLVSQFLSPVLSGHLKENLLSLQELNQMTFAGIGNDTDVMKDKNVRSDKICWLDRKNDNQYENAFLDIIDQFVAYLNKTCYCSITGYEFHYALYETGSFYKRHLDQFRNNDSRQYSMIYYLNTEWVISDGGALVIYLEDQEKNILPTNGKSVFFKSSELEHEVQITNRPRMSITEWLKNN